MAGLEHAKVRGALAQQRVEPKYVSDSYQPPKMGGGEIAPYDGPSRLVFGDNASTQPATAKEDSSVEAVPAPKGILTRILGTLGDNLQNVWAGPTAPGEVRTPGRTATADGRPNGSPTGGGIAALIPFAAIDPLLAAELVELYQRSEKANHEHIWRVFEKGEVFGQGDIYQNGGRSVGRSSVRDKGKLIFDAHTHPPISTFANNGEHVRPVGTQTNKFSPQDVFACRVFVEQHPGVICAAIVPNGLLVYLDDRPQGVEADQSGKAK